MRLGVGSSLVFLGSFLVAAFSSHSFTPSYDSSATSTSPYTVALTTTGNIDLIVGGSNGANTVGTDNLSIVSSCPAGYNLTLSSTSADPTLYKDGDSTSSSKISSTTHSLATPGALGTNEYGFSLGTASNNNNNGNSSNPPTTFSAIPSSTSPITIKTANETKTGTATPTTVSTPIYYGVNVDPTGLSAGSYTGSITYTATMAPACATYTLKVNPNGNGNGTTSTDTTSQNYVSGSLVDQQIQYGSTIDLSSTGSIASTFSRTGYTLASFNTKADGSGYSYSLQAGTLIRQADLTHTIDQSTNAIIGDEITLYAIWQPIAYRQIVQVRYENADGSWGSYSNAIDQDYNYGTTVSWSRAQDATYQAASLTSYTVTEAKTSQVSVYRRDYTVTWNGNGGSSPTAYTRNAGQAIGSLPSSSRTNYTFNGWYTATSGGTKITTATTVTANVIYYAQWTYSPPPPTLSSITQMQQMTSSICSNTSIGSQKTLTDTRDNKTYVVRKLEDGKCWMLQNLRLGDVGTSITLTSTNSDVSSNFTIPSSAIQNSGSTDWSGGSSYSASSAWDVARVYSNGNAWIAPTSEGNYSTVNTTGTPPSQSQYIGNYYNWYTATAGTGTTSVTFSNATSSICPKGWKLPTEENSGDFYGLVTTALNASGAAGSWKLQSSPYYFGLSGYYRSGVSSQGSSGRWWSSSAGSAYSYSFHLGASSVDSSDYNYDTKYYGLSVRCLAR